jgi:hypothetical protein
MTIYETARDLKLPGAVVSAHIDPTKVSPRIKKMVQTMLRKGQLKGGWDSKSIMLARKLLEGKNIPVLHGWNSFYRAEPFNAETLAFFDEMFEANASLEKMGMSAAQRESKWYIERVEENLQDHKRLVRRVTTEAIALHLHMESNDLREQVNEKLLSLRMPEDVAALHAVADRLDDPTPIPLNIRI